MELCLQEPCLHRSCHPSIWRTLSRSSRGHLLLVRGALSLHHRAPQALQGHRSVVLKLPVRPLRWRPAKLSFRSPPGSTPAVTMPTWSTPCLCVSRFVTRSIKHCRTLHQRGTPVTLSVPIWSRIRLPVHVTLRSMSRWHSISHH